jgi:hypothetical protein
LTTVPVRHSKSEQLEARMNCCEVKEIFKKVTKRNKEEKKEKPSIIGSKSRCTPSAEASA